MLWRLIREIACVKVIIESFFRAKFLTSQLFSFSSDLDPTGICTMSSAKENGAEAAAGSKKKEKTIEGIYQKKTQLEHILLRPDTYIGSVEFVTELMWIYDKESESMIQKEIKYVPGLYKIFDEILVNAADNKQRDPKMDCIKIDIDR